MKGLVRRITSLAFVLILVLGSVTVAYASTTGNTKLIKRAETIEGYTLVTNDDKALCKLKVKREDDTFDMYCLTELTWSENNGIKNVDIQWTNEVKSWIDNPDNGFTDEKYKTPTALGAAEGLNTNGAYVDETSVINLLKAMKEDENLMASLAAKKVGYHTATENSAKSDENPNLVTVVPDMNDTVFANAYTISEIPFGVYFIDSKGGTRNYQPVMLNLIPEQVGPTGNWYVKNNLEFTLKYEDVGLKKKINGKDYDIVRAGELVNFDVTIELPTYQKDKDGNYEYKLLNAYDDMAQGFSLVPLSAKLFYYDKAGKEYHPEVNMNVDSYGNMSAVDTEGTYEAILATDANVYYSSTDNQDVFFGTKTGTTGQYQFWGSVNGNFEKLGAYAESSTAYTTLINAYNQKLSAAGLPTVSYKAADIKKREYTKSFISIKLDYIKLMDTLEIDNEHFTPYTMKVIYQSLVNENAFVGNDNNTNDVYLYYIGDSAGNMAISEDEVKAWTYAANIVKVDGDTVGIKDGEDGDGNPIYKDPTYLEGAVFDLYRYDMTYCGGATATSAPAQDDPAYKDYVFYTDSNGASSYENARKAWVGTPSDNPKLAFADGLLYKAIYYRYASDNTVAMDAKPVAIGTEVSDMVTKTTDYSTLDKATFKYGYAAASDENMAIMKTYILTGISGLSFQYVPVKVSSCDKCATEHYHVDVYTVFKDNIESTKTADGIDVVGLDPSTYLLVEKTAPSGYNELSEAIQFQIKEYDADQSAAAGNSYKGFIADDETNYTDGVYAIMVKNFKGMLLPSTGGMGTLLFTIVGILIMGTAIVVVVIKSRKRQAEYF